MVIQALNWFKNRIYILVLHFKLIIVTIILRQLITVSLGYEIYFINQFQQQLHQVKSNYSYKKCC